MRSRKKAAWQVDKRNYEIHVSIAINLFARSNPGERADPWGRMGVSERSKSVEFCLASNRENQI